MGLTWTRTAPNTRVSVCGRYTLERAERLPAGGRRRFTWYAWHHAGPDRRVSLGIDGEPRDEATRLGRQDAKNACHLHRARERAKGER